jgi:hypothetical protein
MSVMWLACMASRLPPVRRSTRASWQSWVGGLPLSSWGWTQPQVVVVIARKLVVVVLVLLYCMCIVPSLFRDDTRICCKEWLCLY